MLRISAALDSRIATNSSALIPCAQSPPRQGQQKVTVEHVHVHAGGQAIVGAVNSGRGVEKSEEQADDSPAQISHEPGTALRSPDPERKALPVASSTRKMPL